MQQTASATPSRQERRVRRTRAMILAGFIQLMQQKPVKDISVRELADLVDINRSTFYLHYQNMTELLEESIAYMNRQFYECFPPKHEDAAKAHFLSPAYLEPYLTYVKEHRRLFRTALRQSAVLHSEEQFRFLFQEVFSPYMARLGIPERERPYMIQFYLHGILAIVELWLEQDCREPVDDIIEMILRYTHTGEAT